MSTDYARAHPRCLWASGLTVSLSTVALALTLAAASAQQVSPQVRQTTQAPLQIASPPAADTRTRAAPNASSPTEPAPPPSYRPGFLHTLGHWFSRSVSSINWGFKSAGRTITNVGGGAGQAAKGVASTATQVAKGTADTLIHLPNTRIVNGRERCAPAPNGAPDCYAAATALCRDKGFRGGKSLETQATRKCPIQVWLQGSSAGTCTTDTFVTRAVCN